ncbi:hypothetical protein VCEC0009_000236B, partial [Vibrio cholerae O1 str. EC-0009]
GGGGGG